MRSRGACVADEPTLASSSKSILPCDAHQSTQRHKRTIRSRCRQTSGTLGPRHCCSRCKVGPYLDYSKMSKPHPSDTYPFPRTYKTATVRYYDEARTRVFVLRCRRESYRQAWAAMTLVTAVGGQRPCSIGVLRVSGEKGFGWLSHPLVAFSSSTGVLTDSTCAMHSLPSRLRQSLPRGCVADSGGDRRGGGGVG